MNSASQILQQLEQFAVSFSLSPSCTYLWNETPYGPILPGTHSHQHWEIRVILSGKVPWPDGPEDNHPPCLLIPPHRLHQRFPQESSCIWSSLVVNGDGVWRLRSKDGRLGFGSSAALLKQLLGRSTGEFLDAFAHSVCNDPRHQVLWVHLFRSLFSVILVEVESVLRNTNAPYGEDLVWRAMNYMRTCYANPQLTVEEIARASGCTAGHLAHCFRRKLDVTVRASLIRLRLEKARLLLSQGRYCVKEVAYLTGWNSPFHFSTQYRRLFGHPPRNCLPEAVVSRLGPES